MNSMPDGERRSILALNKLRKLLGILGAISLCGAGAYFMFGYYLPQRHAEFLARLEADKAHRTEPARLDTTELRDTMARMGAQRGANNIIFRRVFPSEAVAQAAWTRATTRVPELRSLTHRVTPNFCGGGGYHLSANGTGAEEICRRSGLGCSAGTPQIGRVSCQQLNFGEQR